MIGTALSKLLIERAYQVIILTRNKKTSNLKHPAGPSGQTSNLSYANWDIKKQTIDKEAIGKADYVIHLAGAGIADKRWTEKRKKEIRESRTNSSEFLVKSIREVPNNIKAVISASAVGWYGADPQIPNRNPFDESMPADKGFLGETCRLWEQSIEPVTALGKRLVKLRTGIVFSNDGGAFKEFKKPVRMGVAAILGNGKQVISWVHIEDISRMYLLAIENENMQGAYNAVAPYPVSNKKLMIELARRMKGRFYLPVHVPRFVLKLALGEMAVEILKSTTATSDKIHRSGFTFLFPSIESALNELIKK